MTPNEMLKNSSVGFALSLHLNTHILANKIVVGKIFVPKIIEQCSRLAFGEARRRNPARECLAILEGNECNICDVSTFLFLNYFE